MGRRAQSEGVVTSDDDQVAPAGCSALVAWLRAEMDRAWEAAVRCEAKQMAMFAGCTWCPSEEDVDALLPAARALLERQAGLGVGELDGVGGRK